MDRLLGADGLQHNLCHNFFWFLCFVYVVYKGSLVLVEQANCSKDESSFSSFTQKSKFRMIVGWMDFFGRNRPGLWVASLLSIGSARVCLHIGALAGSNEWGTGCVAAENKIVLIHIGEEGLICRRYTLQTFDVIFCCNKVMKWCLELHFQCFWFRWNCFYMFSLVEKVHGKRRTEAWPNRQHSSHLWLLQEVLREAWYCKSWGRGGEVVAAREYFFWWHAKIVL